MKKQINCIGEYNVSQPVLACSPKIFRFSVTTTIFVLHSDVVFRHYKKKLDAFRQSVGNHLKRKTEETDNFSHSNANTGFLNSSHNSSNSGSPNYSSRIIPEFSAISPNCNIADQNGKIPRLERHSMDDAVTDTVGVVVMDSSGNVASTVSSGGIALKQPGRVGQASCFGCGCWAQRGRASQGKPYTVGISTTGCGEHLVRTFLARECALELNRSANPVDALQKGKKIAQKSYHFTLIN